MIIDTTQTALEKQMDDEVKSFVYGRAERSHGWEYMVLSDDQESTGYPIEPLAYGIKTPGTNFAFLIDDAGIIWTCRDGIFKRYCKGAALAYVITYFGSFESESADKLSLKQHNKWCFAAGRTMNLQAIKNDKPHKAEHTDCPKCESSDVIYLSYGYTEKWYYFSRGCSVLDDSPRLKVASMNSGKF